MKKYVIRASIFLFAFFIIYGALGLLDRIKPFKIQSLLPDNHPVRDLYEDYVKKYDDDRKVFILVERQQNPFSDLEISTLSKGIFDVLDHVRHVQNIVSISEAKYTTFKDKRLQLIPFIEDNLISDEANLYLKKKLWEKTLLSINKKAILITFEVSRILKRAEEVPLLDRIMNKVNKSVSSVKNADVHYFGSKVANYHFTYEMRKNQNIITPILLLLVGFFLLLLFRSFQVVFWSFFIMILSYCSIIIIIILNEGGIGPYSVFSLSFIFIIATSDLIHYFSRFSKLKGVENGKKAFAARNEILKPCFFTSITTALGFISLMLNDTLPIRYFGLYCSLGSLLCFFLTFYVLPFILHNFNFKLAESRQIHIKTNSIYKLATTYPRSIITIFSILSVVLLIGSLRITMDDNLYTKFRSYHPLTKSVFAFHDSLELAGSIDVLLKPKNIKESISDKKYINIIDRFHKEIESLSTISHIKSLPLVMNDLQREISVHKDISDKKMNKIKYSIFRLLRDYEVLKDVYNAYENEQRMIVFLNSMKSNDLEDSINKINKLSEKYPSLTVQINGFSVVRNFINTMATTRFIQSFALCLVLIFITFIVIFRSFKVGVLAIIPNIFPLLTISGLMGLFSITMESNLVVLTCITIGIAVDDTIHFLFELKKQLKTKDLNSSLKEALDKTGKALIGTTSIFIFCFPCFLISDLKLFFQVGVFLLLSLVVALICDFLLLPAILTKTKIKL